ncbi:hypothetical protein ACIP9H_40245 [Streptomyces sp. NPDC088732]|uniref:hypothetical protein n=1 Tax=Streptomyces sp. NPDC088732 TaxID=3365879 RepID=UPI0038263D30
MRSGTKTTAAVAAVVLPIGITVILWGVWLEEPARAIAGACLALTASALIALHLIRGWVTDTTAERARLAESTRRADDEYDRYVAGRAAQTAERERMRRDTEMAAAAMARQLDSERRKMQDQFDAERSDLIARTFATSFELLQHGLPTPSQGRDRSRDVVIPFPAQHPAEVEQSRGRDVSR